MSKKKQEKFPHMGTCVRAIQQYHEAYSLLLANAETLRLLKDKGLLDVPGLNPGVVMAVDNLLRSVDRVNELTADEE